MDTLDYVLILWTLVTLGVLLYFRNTSKSHIKRLEQMKEELQDFLSLPLLLDTDADIKRIAGFGANNGKVSLDDISIYFPARSYSALVTFMLGKGFEGPMLLDMCGFSAEEVLNARGFGDIGLRQLRYVMEEFGLYLKGDAPSYIARLKDEGGWVFVPYRSLEDR